jgi:tetratricopeptide (TPR) repeat protein
VAGSRTRRSGLCARRRGRSSGAAQAALCLLLASAAAHAGADEAVGDAQRVLTDVNRNTGAVEQAIARARADERSPEARIADAELLLGNKDYEHASVLLNQVVEKYPNHATAYPDALFLLGETYFGAKQYYSARRVYRQIVDRGSERRFTDYQAKALARLVDVAIRIQDYTTLDELFARMGAMSTSSPGYVELAYARGKGLYAKGDLAGAKTALASVAPTSPYFPQSRYLLGVVAMKEAPRPAPAVTTNAKSPSSFATAADRARYAPAVEAFRQVTRLPPDTPEHREVIDLAWLAIGRLFYETDQFSDAIEAYNHVDRNSPEFSRMLYELAWVYVRLGDADRAQRSLEVLSIADPGSSNMPDATLLRADLMLRAGQFEKALNLYQSARAQFDPMRDQVETFLSTSTDPAVYYDKLSNRDELAGMTSKTDLPPIAVTWAREEGNGPAAFAVIDDVSQSRDLIKGANQYVEKLTALLSAPNRVRAFPELKAGEERALALLNSVSKARVRLAEGLDDVENSSVSDEMERVRNERRTLQKRMQYLPVTDGDFADRENQAQKQWNSVSQKLQQLTLQVDQLQAIINGLKRTLREGAIHGVTRDLASQREFEAELTQNEHDIGVYKQEMDALRKMVDSGRAQVGFGDQRFVEDAEVRVQFRRVLNEEVRLVRGGAAGGSANSYAQRIEPVLAQADATDTRLEAMYAELEQRVGVKAAELRATVDAEVAKIAGYQASLDGLDSEARTTVGEVARYNFEQVRDRLRNIVLRSDVGVTEEAWEVREEELTRVRNLQLERSRSAQQLNEELREVLDDSGDTAKSQAPEGTK